MPFLHEHDSQLGNLADLAANAGGFATQGVLQQRDLARASFDQHARLANDAQAANVYGEILRDQQLQDRLESTERLAGVRGNDALQRADLVGQYGLAKEGMRGQTATGIAQSNQAAANDRLGQTLDNRTALAGQASADRRYGVDMATGAKYDDMELRERLAAQREETSRKRMEEAQKLERMKTQEQLARRANDAQQSVQLRMTLAKAQDLHRQEAMIWKALDNPGLHPVNRANLLRNKDDIRLAIEQLMNPAQVDNLAPMMMDGGGGGGGDMPQQAMPQQQPQQGAPPPQHITDGAGVAWVFTGQFDPRTGEPLYQEMR